MQKTIKDENAGVVSKTLAGRCLNVKSLVGIGDLVDPGSDRAN